MQIDENGLVWSLLITLHAHFHSDHLWFQTQTWPPLMQHTRWTTPSVCPMNSDKSSTAAMAVISWSCSGSRLDYRRRGARRQRFVRTSWSSQNSLSLMLQRRQLASRSASARLANRISPPLSGKLNVLSCPFRYRHFQNQLKEKFNKHSTICFSIGTFTPARLMWPSPQCSASTGWLRSLGWSRWWR